MTENKDNGGPAFPVPGLSNLPNGEFIHPYIGMSLRDYFAAKVCAALMTQTSADRDFPNLGYRRDGESGDTAAQRAAKISYAMADAMLEARK